MFDAIYILGAHGLKNMALRGGNTVDVSPVSLLAAILSITVSVLKLTETRKISAEKAIEDFRKNIATPEQRLVLSIHENVQAVLTTMMIPPKLLEQLTREAEAAEDNHIRERQAGKTIEELEKADRNARDMMCAIMRHIRKHNKGKLPVGPYQNWWDAYDCPE